MTFEIRPQTFPRSIPFGRQGFAGGISAPPNYRQRGVQFDIKTASPETTMDNPPGAGPSSIFKPSTPSDPNRKVTAEDVYAFYGDYLGRTPEFGVEVGGAAEGSAPGTGTTGRIGGNFNATVNEFRNSQEFKDRVTKGFRPNFNPYTGSKMSNTLGQLGEENAVKYAEGGIVGEPVVGRGMKSGKKYLIGEDGPELVTPLSRPPEKEPKPFDPRYGARTRTPQEQDDNIAERLHRPSRAESMLAQRKEERSRMKYAEREYGRF